MLARAPRRLHGRLRVAPRSRGRRRGGLGRRLDCARRRGRRGTDVPLRRRGRSRRRLRRVQRRACPVRRLAHLRRHLFFVLERPHRVHDVRRRRVRLDLLAGPFTRRVVPAERLRLRHHGVDLPARRPSVPRRFVPYVRRRRDARHGLSRWHRHDEVQRRHRAEGREPLHLSMNTARRAVMRSAPFHVTAATKTSCSLRSNPAGRSPWRPGACSSPACSAKRARRRAARCRSPRPRTRRS